MSHTYFVTVDNTSSGKHLETVGPSNSSHEDWMVKAKLTRTMRNTLTGHTEEWPYSTTIHDAEPLHLASYEFADYVEKAQEAYGEEVPDHMQMLHDFVAAVEAHEVENNITYTVWLY